MKVLMVKGKYILIVCFILVILIVAIYNIIHFGYCNFLQASVSQLLTLLVAIIVSYYLVQKRSDEKNKKEIIIRLLADIQKEVTNEDAYRISVNSKPATLTLRNRTLNNYLDTLSNYGELFGISEQVCFLQEKLSEYTDCIGNHIDDIDFLSKAELDLQRPLALINSKAYEIMLNLY